MKSKELKYVLIIEADKRNIIRAIFDTKEEAEKYAEDELISGTPYTISSAFYHTEY